MKYFYEIKSPSVLYDKSNSTFLYITKKEGELIWIFIIGMSKDMNDLTDMDRLSWDQNCAVYIEEITKSPATKAVIRDIFEEG